MSSRDLQQAVSKLCQEHFKIKTEYDDCTDPTQKAFYSKVLLQKERLVRQFVCSLSKITDDIPHVVFLHETLVDGMSFGEEVEEAEHSDEARFSDEVELSDEAEFSDGSEVSAEED